MRFHTEQRIARQYKYVRDQTINIMTSSRGMEEFHLYSVNSPCSDCADSFLNPDSEIPGPSSFIRRMADNTQTTFTYSFGQWFDKLKEFQDIKPLINGRSQYRQPYEIRQDPNYDPFVSKEAYAFDNAKMNYYEKYDSYSNGLVR